MLHVLSSVAQPARDALTTVPGLEIAVGDGMFSWRLALLAFLVFAPFLAILMLGGISSALDHVKLARRRRRRRHV